MKTATSDGRFSEKKTTANPLTKTASILLVLRGTTVLQRHRGTIFLRYHRTSTVAFAVLLVPQYHKFRGSSARYLSVVDTQ